MRNVKYIRTNYNVPAYIGRRILYTPENREGTIVGAHGAHLRIRLDGDDLVQTFHPVWGIRYLD